METYRPCLVSTFATVAETLRAGDGGICADVAVSPREVLHDYLCRARKG